MRYFLVLLFFVSQLVLARDVNVDRMLSVSKVRAESFLKNEIEKVLKDRFLLTKFFINIDMTINTQKILKDRGIERVNEIKKGGNLPGINIDLSNFDLDINLKDITNDELMYYIESLNVTLDIPKQIKPELTTNIESVVTINLKKFGIEKVVVKTSPTEFIEPIEQIKEEIKAQAAGQEEIEQRREKTFINLIDYMKQSLSLNFYILLVVLVLLAIVSIWILSKTGRSAADAIATALKNIDINIPSSSPAPAMASQNNPQNQNTVNSTSDSSYKESILKINDIFKSDPVALDRLLILLLKIEDYYSIIVLSDVLGASIINKKIPEQFKPNYRNFIKSHGFNLINNKAKLHQAIQSLEGILWIAQNAPEELESFVLKFKFSQLDEGYRLALSQELNLQHLHVIFEAFSPSEMAQILWSNTILMEEIKSIDFNHEILAKDYVDLLRLVTNTVNQQKINKVDELKTFLPFDVEKEIDRKLGVQTKLENLAETEMQSAYSYLNTLSIDELVGVLAILPENLRQEYVQSLPEIKRKRVLNKEMIASSTSYQYKHQLMNSIGRDH